MGEQSPPHLALENTQLVHPGSKVGVKAYWKLENNVQAHTGSVLKDSPWHTAQSGRNPVQDPCAYEWEAVLEVWALLLTQSSSLRLQVTYWISVSPLFHQHIPGAGGIYPKQSVTDKKWAFDRKGTSAAKPQVIEKYREAASRVNSPTHFCR